MSSALRMRVLTVPSGSPVISAISEWVRPSKKAISRVLRCSRGSWTDDGAGALHQGIALSLVGEVEGRGEGDVVDVDGGALAAERVDGAVARDDGEPAAEAAAGGGEAVGIAPDLHEDFLKDILGRGRVAQDTEGDGVDELRVAVEEGGHGLLVARLDQREEGCIVLGGWLRHVRTPVSLSIERTRGRPGLGRPAISCREAKQLIGVSGSRLVAQARPSGEFSVLYPERGAGELV